MRDLVLLAACAFFVSASQAQNMRKPVTGENFRGLSAPSSSVVWASGTHGTYVLTTDGGSTWRVAQVPGATSLDFRDIEAFNAHTAYLLAAGPGEQSRIYKTENGGKDWALQFTNHDPKGFFDCMGFWDRDHGIAVGDPVNGHFQLIKTDDGGKSWSYVPPDTLPPAIDAEGAFAASGTCLVTKGKRNVWFASGGSAARVFRSSDRGKTWQVSETPIAHTKASEGIFSLDFRDARNGIAVGGDYANPKSATNNIAVTRDGGQTWSRVNTQVQSVYLSAVKYWDKKRLLAAGTTGFAFSNDEGNSWFDVTGEGFNALSVVPCDFVPDSGPCYVVAGSGGRIERFPVVEMNAARPQK